VFFKTDDTGHDAMTIRYLMPIISPCGLLLVAGCATVTRGTTDPVTINSEPPGAQATTSIGHQCPSTPCTFEVSRKAEFVVSYRKDGYEDQQVPVTTKVAGAGAAGLAGNVLIGGVVGMGVDVATGATLEHVPNPVFATLVPLARPEPVKPVRKKAPVRKEPVLPRKDETPAAPAT
jgi:hypothetical protein